MKSPRLVRIAPLALLSAFQAPAPDPAGAPPEVVRWVTDASAALGSLETGRGDWSALKAIAGDARIVALGEATHGSHEFFAFKARAFEYLASELGFTDFAMETDWTQALAVNDFVEFGRGDLESAVKNLAILWRTAEYRELLAWMRAWNADAAHARKLRFHGLDYGSPPLTARRLNEYLKKVDAEVAESVAPVIERLGNGASVEEADIEGLSSLFDELKEVFVERSSAAEWALHRQHVAILAQVYRQRAKGGNAASSWRDRCMADNARWILRTAGPDARLVLSAHNGHVSRAGLGPGGVESIGHALAQDAAAVKDENLSMVVIGSAFGRGSFYAYPATGGVQKAFTVGEPRSDGIESACLAAGAKLALLDLRRAPDGPVRAWIGAEHPLRFVGGTFDVAWPARGDDVQPARLSSEFDALFFVAETTPSRLLNPPR